MYKQDDFQAKEDSMVFHSHTMALIYVEVLYCQDCVSFVLDMGHSMSNQHAKWTPVTDFAETW